MPDTEKFDLYGFTQKLATEMGDEWEAEYPSDDAYRERAYLRRIDDKTCRVLIAGPDRYASHGKLHLSGSFDYNNGSGDGLGYHETRASINVSATKTPGQVAKDIQRRLLPLYLEQHARNKAYVTEQRAWQAEQTATATAIDAMVKAYNAAHPYTTGKVYLIAQVDGKADAKLTISNVPLALAQHIIDLLP